MLRHFETEYEDPIDEIVGDDPEFKKINDRFFAKSEEFCKLVGGANFPVWDLFEEVMDEYHSIELLLCKAMYLQGAEDREKMLKNNSKAAEMVALLLF